MNNWLEEAGRGSVQATLLGIYGTTCIFCMIIVKLDMGIVSYVHQRSVTESQSPSIYGMVVIKEDVSF